MGRSRRRWKTICELTSSTPAATTGQGRLSSTAYVPAGCPGMQRSESSLWVIPKSCGIQTAPTDGRKPICPCSCRRRNRGQSNSHLLWGGCGGSIMSGCAVAVAASGAVEARSRPGTRARPHCDSLDHFADSLVYSRLPSVTPALMHFEYTTHRRPDMALLGPTLMSASCPLLRGEAD